MTLTIPIDYELSALADPGECDLTADVNFSHIRAVAESLGIDCSKSVTQQDFLKNMGIETRLLMLLNNTKNYYGKFCEVLLMELFMISLFLSLF